MNVEFRGIVCESLKFDSKPAGHIKVTLVSEEVQQWVQLLVGGDIVEPFSIEFALLFDMPGNRRDYFTSLHNL